MAIGCCDDQEGVSRSEVTQSKAVRKSERLQRTTKESTNVADHPPPSPISEQIPRYVKRKRDPVNDDVSDRKQAIKRACLATPPSHGQECGNAEEHYGSSIHWEEYFGEWPSDLTGAVTRMMRQPRSAKRSQPPSRQNSYSQSVRDGGSPAAWTSRHEEKMQEAGMNMLEYGSSATITNECQRLCDGLLNTDYALPKEPAFDLRRFARVLRGVQYRNETRVVRDITPIVVPSAELLHIDGYANLEHICEAVNAEWTQCDTIHGPRPKPDFAAGISASAFTNKEKEKLQVAHTSACPNLFPESMYFPFLICEVKSNDRSIREAERQAMHGVSIAIRAVIRLYQKTPAVMDINRKILAFSIVHDGRTVKIFGHFATIEGEKIAFFRHPLYTTDFATDLAFQKMGQAYKIVRAIYEDFFPKHLARITFALSQLRNPSLASFTDQLGLDEGSRESTPGQSSSQEDGSFKKPSLPSETKLQEENDRLRKQYMDVLREQQAEGQRQRNEQQQQLTLQKEQMDRQMAEQKEESREQKAMMERQMAEQKEESREQKAMMERQMAQLREQMEQQREIITLLKEKVPK